MAINSLGPAYYEDNKFGIRISDVLHAINLPDSSEYFEGDGACQFKDISMVPIQTKMININLLTREEVSSCHWVSTLALNLSKGIPKNSIEKN